MSEKTTTEFDEAVALALKLSPVDKVHLVERVVATLEADLPASRKQSGKQPKRSLYGLWSNVRVSAEDIDEARREMWGNFPREDI